MGRVIVVSGDGHVGAEPETYREYLDPQFRGALPDLERENADFRRFAPVNKDTLSPEQLAVVDGDGAIRAGGEFGAWDVGIRLRELDREGVAAEIVHGGHQCAILPFFSVMNTPYPADLRAAGARAYHRWLADCIAESGGRMIGVADPGPCLDLDDTARELRWVAEHGFRSVSLVQQAWNADLPPIYDAYYEPFWAACTDLGLVLSVHAGWGSPQGKFQEFTRQFNKLIVGASDEEIARKKKTAVMDAMAMSEESPLQLDMGPRRALWQLMLGGVFDRHPDLRLVLTEVRADWLPATIARLDRLHADLDTPLTMKPSEYFARHCLITPSSIHRCEIEMRHEIGVEQLMFGTDYPHPEGTWPNTKDWIRASFVGVPEAEARAILGENAIRCYGLDGNALASVADRIGSTATDLFAAPAVPAERLAAFNARSGFARGPEAADPGVIDALFDADLHALVEVR